MQLTINKNLNCWDVFLSVPVETYIKMMVDKCCYHVLMFMAFHSNYRGLTPLQAGNHGI